MPSVTSASVAEFNQRETPIHFKSILVAPEKASRTNLYFINTPAHCRLPEVYWKSGLIFCPQFV